MFNRKTMKRMLASASLATVLGAGSQAHAIEVAGTLFVDLNATSLPTGAAPATWSNAGTIGDFVKVGTPVVVTRDGARGINFNSVGAGDSFESLLSAPAGLVGAGATRTIETWVWNPGSPDEETILSWGHRGGPEGSNMSFNYGNHALFGAVGHWGCCPGPDIGWNDGGGSPVPGTWHHLAYTYDGNTTRVYADGVLANSEVIGGIINTHAAPKISIAQQHDNAAGTFTGGLQGTMVIGAVRIHDGVLDDSQIAANHAEERALFPLPALPVPEQLPLGPAHRWSFNDGTANDSIGGLHGTPINGAPIAGGKVSFNGVDQYVDLGGNDVAILAIDNGAISIESWGMYDPATGVWSRIIDLGDTNPGTLGRNYVLVTPLSGAGTTRMSISDADPGFNHENWTDGAATNTGVPVHIVAVFDDANDTETLYINGIKVASSDMTISLSSVSGALGYLAKSLYPDAYLNGMLDEVRIYNYALSANQVLGNYEYGPDTLNVIPEPGMIGGLSMMLAGLAGLSRRGRKA